MLLDQFSIAGWPGNADDTRRKEESRQGVMRKFMQDIATLEPRYVIPFASFVRFSHRENAHMNLHMNTIDDVAVRVDPSRLVRRHRFSRVAGGVRAEPGGCAASH